MKQRGPGQISSLNVALVFYASLHHSLAVRLTPPVLPCADATDQDTSQIAPQQHISVSNVIDSAQGQT